MPCMRNPNMTTSKKQIKANRINAQKSTGPKSVEGKEISSHNALTHGLFSRDILINSPGYSDDPQEYEEVRQSIFNELRPIGMLEEHLVMKIVNCIWRLRRAVAAENGSVSRQLDEIENDLRRRCEIKEWRESENPDFEGLSEEEIRRMRRELTRDKMIPEARMCRNITRYEMRLDRQMVRAFRLLKMLRGEDCAMGEVVQLGRE